VSEIARTPGEAVLLPSCRCFLSLLAGKVSVVAVVSGRSVAAARNMVGLDNLVYIGSHGMERWREGRTEYLPGLEKYPEIIGTVLSKMEPCLKEPGIIVEDKKVTASIHYRLTANPSTARETIVRALAEIPEVRELRIMQNKMIIELLPKEGFNKGVAVSSLIKEYHLRGAIYLGDDITDVDAFKALHGMSSDGFIGYAIAVTSSEMPAGLTEEADFTVSSVSDVARFFAWLYGILWW
jgi:trehalose 6-phosphate phosphatase